MGNENAAIGSVQLASQEDANWLFLAGVLVGSVGGFLAGSLLGSGLGLALRQRVRRGLQRLLRQEEHIEFRALLQ
ncbi:MAG: hypothetical protein HYX89_04625 [Chloroflexi bacterium]|nr:hypothetical protein [Chloroflexota bacterium]